jgi:tRNA (uracil-5-)-methyltransferase TRM9
MSPETILALNEINRRFYRTSAEAFSASRDYPWLGWERIVGGLPEPPRSVLDVGCGNGRFGVYLAAWLGGEFSYLGLDASAELLALARRQTGLPADTTLVQRDLVADPSAEALPAGRHPLVAVFGLLHHVPSFDRRRELLGALADRLEPGGRLAVSVWRFGAFERFRHKRVPFEPPVDTADLEPGDALLSFGEEPGAVRYCHFLDGEEIDRLVAAAALPCLDRFSADGREGALNDYLVLGRAR